ncbi:hypothetical protein G3A_02280 [Bacillus sp. 17376]|uniref:SH3b domain-containing protein n=1 Tax=Mesobacillus boroniphilus JCM 21738 TaxID=1294265 RepID=W4RIY2_9BACI|nr:SH3 domain-containing protein [Mesobacillus boroniphilus]ESU34204.1 hypothetical protein G3A_02280 [Bacillus sp. 17376]GAE44097.1 hypothetical protein JCM21738_779 [Mesobacillus boroniphilus JCM 21738]
MKKHQLVKTLISSALILPAVVSIQAPSTEAATTTQIASAVQKAISNSQILRRATSIEWNGDGKTRPYTEYNNTKAAYYYAEKLVKAMPSSNTKVVYQAKLGEVKTQIDRAVAYIDAITAGEKIVVKKNALQSQVNKGLLTAETESLYHSLSFEIGKQAKLLDRVYGVTTREYIRQYYKQTSERLRDDLSYPVTAKMALDQIETSKSNEEILRESKKVLMFLQVVPQKSFKEQLTVRWKSLEGKVPSTIQDAEYKNLLSVYNNMAELEKTIKPGVSSPKVPLLFEETKNGIAQVGHELAKRKLDETLTNVMNNLYLSVSEIKTLLTKKAAEKGIPPEIVKSIALTENGNFQQFLPNGEVFESFDNGYGIMQVTPLSEHDTRYDWEKVKYDLGYNIETGVNILLEKWGYSGSRRLPVVNDGNKETLENWYFAIIAYNGLSKRNDPITSSKATYQEKVYANLSSMKPEIISEDQLKISYNPATGQMLFNDKMLYVTTKKTKSAQLYKVGDTLSLPSAVNLRKVPTTVNNTPIKQLEKGTAITIIDQPTEDSNKFNIFTWYKVKVNSTGETGYVASLW